MIYTVTAVATYAINGVERSHYDEFPRCFGYFEKLEDAKLAVKENRCDLRENYYNYVVIEEYSEGIHCLAKNTLWFKWVGENGKDLTIDINTTHSPHYELSEEEKKKEKEEEEEFDKEFDKGNFVECEQPKVFQGSVNFAMG